jgi:hypothetical protein
MAYQLLLTRAQVERIVRALKASPEPCDTGDDPRWDSTEADHHNLFHLGGALEMMLESPEDDDTTHGICL